jgi:hypothetical protein
MKYGKLIGAIAVTFVLALATASPVVAAETGTGEIRVGGEKTPPAASAEPEESKWDWGLHSRRGLYGGVGVGVADHQGGGSTEATWRMDVWVRIINYFSLQFGYADLNDANHGDVDGVTYGGVVHLPLADLVTLHGKVGGMTATTRNKDNTDSSTQSELTYGAGVSVSLPFEFGVRAEWEHYDFGRDIDAGWLSLYYKFGTW